MQEENSWPRIKNKEKLELIHVLIKIMILVSVNQTIRKTCHRKLTVKMNINRIDKQR